MYDQLSTNMYSHSCEHVRTLLKNQKLKQRARRELQTAAKFAAIEFVEQLTEKNSFHSSSPISPIKFFSQKSNQQKTKQSCKNWTLLQVSKHAQNTVNPIRKICDSLEISSNKLKKPIYLNLGDPTLVGNLPPSPATINAMHDVIDSHKFDGYGPSVGIESARESIALYFSTPEAPILADDVILSSGCSHALEMAIVAVANPGDNILVPIPGFPLYSTLCKANNIDYKQYVLKMNNGGLVDLKHLEKLINNKTKAIIVNNPSNPTGVVFPKKHLEEICKIAYKKKVIIIADEIYGNLVYKKAKFFPLATLFPKVPIITCDGIAKRYLVPGWRLGWLIIHNRYGVLTEIKKGIVALSQKIIGPCALVQGALPRILNETPESFFNNIINVISTNSNIVYESLSRVSGLKPLQPQGAMYMMVSFDYHIYGEETKFLQGLIFEQSVYCLPGSVFNLPNWFRLVLTYPENVTREACQRIVEYCKCRLKAYNHLAMLYRCQQLKTDDKRSDDSLSNDESDN